MKIQNLSIIFLVIIIPLIMILSYYLDLQKDTLELQTEYDTKLSEATKEGIKAFEVNTVDWSEWVSEKTRTTERDDARAAINTLITSLANNLNVSGTAKEYMVNYIPAIVVTMYDGYYIYAPSYVPVTIENDNGVQLYYDETQNILTTNSDNGANLPAYEPNSEQTENITFVTELENAEMEYKHTLSTQIAYVEKYSKGSDTNVVINYTLDNRIYLYGIVDGTSVEKDGYLVYFDNNSNLPRIKIDSAVQNDSAIKIINGKGIDETKYSNGEIEAETLEEQILYYEDKDGNGDKEYYLGTFKYVYDIGHNKLYYDENEDDFFTINSSSKEKQYISDSSSIKYKSVSVLLGNEDTTEYKKLYMPLNGADRGIWCISLKEDSEEAKNAGKEEIDTKIRDTSILQGLGLTNGDGSDNLCKDYSAINYYVEAYAFTNWIGDNLGDISVEVEGTSENIFKITATNDPEKDGSPIVVHKEQVMKENIITNLNLSISNYSMGTYEFKLPVLTDNDWDQVFSNISIITFFQGVPIGLKYYNNYSIATSTTNREYVDPEEIYFSGADTNYHKANCEKCGNTVYTGYRSVEYVLKEHITDTGNNIYYYQHDNSGDGNSETACYYCVVNRANYVATLDSDIIAKQTQSYNEALARERYYQKEEISAKMNVTIRYHYNIEGWDDVTPTGGLPEDQEVEIGSYTTISTEKPTITSSDTNIKYVFVGWAESSDSTTIKYMPGDDTEIIYGDEDIDLYAIWRISLSGLGWSSDSDSSISTIDIKDTVVEMEGNRTNPGKGATWTTFKSEYVKIQEFSFKYSVNKGDSFNAAGFMFNVVETDYTLEGYVLSINFKGEFLSNAYGENGAIYKFKYKKGRNSKNVESITLIEALPFGEYTSGRESSGTGTITMKVTDTGYIITGSELTKEYTVTVPANEFSPNTFGFFSDHYSHSCNQIGYFKLEDINVVVVRK